MVRKNIQIIKEPPLEEILRVNQRGFGYLNPEVDKANIETIGLGPCIGVYVRDIDRDLQALAHIDKSLGYEYGVTQFLAYLKNKHLTDENFDEVLVLRSQLADKKGIDEIYLTLRIRGHKPEIVDSDKEIIDVIFDKDGNMYWVDPKTIQAEKRSNLEWRLFGSEMMARNGLKCENTDEIVKDIFDPVYPGVGRTFHVVEENGAYGVRIPVRKEFNQEILDEFKKYALSDLTFFLDGWKNGKYTMSEFNQKILDELKQGIISLSLEECKYGKYITIAKYGYPAFEDTEAVMQINKLSEKFIERMDNWIRKFR